MKQLFFSSALMAVLAVSCGNPSNTGSDQSDTMPLFEITNNPENAQNITLRLVERVDNDSTITYVARGLYETDTVGFNVEMSRQIAAGINSDGSVNEDAGFTTGTITFVRSGPESDRFATVLAALWNINDVSGMKAEPVTPLVFSSNRIDVDYDQSFTYSFKLFFAPDAPVPGEVFFTFDTFKKTINFQEKGEQYRSQIAHSFGQ